MEASLLAVPEVAAGVQAWCVSTPQPALAKGFVDEGHKKHMKIIKVFR